MVRVVFERKVNSKGRENSESGGGGGGCREIMRVIERVREEELKGRSYRVLCGENSGS